MNKELLGKLLEDVIPASRLLRDEPMSAHTTYKIGGPADFFVPVASVEEIEAVLAAAREAGAPWYILGCGSDLLVADEGLRGVVLHFGDDFAAIETEDSTLTAQAGATNAQVAAAALEASLSGYEYASGIPGSIGGGAIMNAGAYGGEFSDVCTQVRCLTPGGDIVTVTNEEAEWGYRHSMMSDRGYIVLDATLQLVPWNKEQIAEKMEDLRIRREEKQPLWYGSAGSTFKRPPDNFAGKLIEEAGMAGYTLGGAKVYDMHCGFVINTGDATATQVRQVIHDVQDAVFADSGVMLEPEVRMWGFDEE